MQNIINALTELGEIDKGIGLEKESAEIAAKIETIKSAKVCTPIIGEFSSGKSRILNSLLGYSDEMLKVDITPQTAVPTELIYSEEENALIIDNEGREKAISVEQFRSEQFREKETKAIRLYLNNSFLRDIPDIKLVDMPGTGSGIESHDKALSGYLPQSMAYLVAFPANKAVLSETFKNILKELGLNNKRICIVVTKCDKEEPDNLNKNIDHLEDSLKSFLKMEFVLCKTSAQEGDDSELQSFLLSLQEEAQQILVSNFKKVFSQEAEIPKKYLSAQLENLNLSESDLAEKEEQMRNERTKLHEDLEDAYKNLESGIPSCVENIKGDVRSSLKGHQESFVMALMKGEDIDEDINSIVRQAFTASVQKHFMPKVQKYLEKTSSIINIDPAVNIELPETGSILVTGAIALALAALLGPISAILYGAYKLFFGSNKSAEQKNAIRKKLNEEIYPQIIEQVDKAVRFELEKQAMTLKEAMNKELSRQDSALEKAFAELQEAKDKEKEDKENKRVFFQQMLERIEALESGL
jgi:predicted GTPase